MSAPRVADRYWVVGHPVGHSVSPRIHTEFARQLGQHITYGLQELPEHGFSTGARALLALPGACGMNVTVPFKEQAYRLADVADRRAAHAAAANTLWRMADGRIAASNTDGLGLVRDLERRCRLTLKGIGVLLIGAGGAARGVIGPLLDAGVGSIQIVNRTVARAEQVACQFAGAPVRATALDAARAGCGLVLHAASGGLQDALPQIDSRVLRGAFCYDMVYSAGHRRTAFTRLARASGASDAADGLGMLVEQAAEAFFLWRGQRPDAQAAYRMLNEGRIDD